MNAPSASRHPYLSPDAPRVLAHRGLVTPDAAAQGVVENSFAAVAEAHAAGAAYVESDCHVTADGEEVEAALSLWSDLYTVERDTRAAWAGVLSALLRDPDFLLY